MSKGYTSVTVSIKKNLKYPERSFSAALKAIVGPPDYADLYDTGEVRMKWNRALSNGEKLKVLEVKEMYIEYLSKHPKTKQPYFITEYIEKGATATSFVVKVLANPDQF